VVESVDPDVGAGVRRLRIQVPPIESSIRSMPEDPHGVCVIRPVKVEYTLALPASVAPWSQGCRPFAVGQTPGANPISVSVGR
jgi:hypothetical protein